MTQGTEPGKDVLTLTFGTKFTASDGAEAVSDSVHRALDAGVRKIIFDLSGVEFIDSLAVGQVVASFVATRNRGGRMVLCSPSPRVSLVLRTANLHLVLDIRATRPADLVWD